jgi:hypothetical protein
MRGIEILKTSSERPVLFNDDGSPVEIMQIAQHVVDCQDAIELLWDRDLLTEIEYDAVRERLRLQTESFNVSIGALPNGFTSNIIAFENFVQRLSGAMNLGAHEHTYDAAILYETAGSHIDASTRVHVTITGDRRGEIDLEEMRALPSKFYDLRFSPKRQEYRFDTAKKKLIITGGSKRSDNKYQVEISAYEADGPEDVK